MWPDEKIQSAPLAPKGIWVLSGIGLVLEIWRTTLQAWLIPSGFNLDFALILVIYLGLYAPFSPAGAAAVVLLGLCYDASVGGLFGLTSWIYLAAFLISGLLHQNLEPTAPRYLIPFLFAFILGANIMTLLALSLLDWPLPPFQLRWSSPTTFFLISGGITAGLGPIFFRIFDMLRLRFLIGPEDEE